MIRSSAKQSHFVAVLIVHKSQTFGYSYQPFQLKVRPDEQSILIWDEDQVLLA